MAHITQEFVKRMVTGKPVARIVPDDEVRGFCVRQTENGATSFIFDYYFGRKRHKIKIGDAGAGAGAWTADAARKKANEWRVEVDNGHDPLAVRKMLKEEPTFKELAVAWLESAKDVKKKRDSSLRDDRQMLGLKEDGTPIVDTDPAMGKRRILPVLGGRRLSEIEQRDVAKFHTSIKETPYRPNHEATPYRANRVLALIKTIFNFGLNSPIYKVWIEENPAKGVVPWLEKEHERCLEQKTDEDPTDEIENFLQALDAYHDQNAANCLRLLLLTGSRESEALKATWEEFNLNEGIWTKPNHKTKQRETEELELGEDTVELLRSMRPKNPTGPLFVGRGGKGQRISLRRPWIQVCKAAGLVTVEEVEGKRIGKDGEPKKLKRYRPTVRIHDLRHTYASVNVRAGVSLYDVAKSLGHRHTSTTERYLHHAKGAGRATANKFAKVIEFKKRSA